MRFICSALTVLFVWQGADTLMRYADEMQPFPYTGSYRELDFSALYGSDYYPEGFDYEDTASALVTEQLTRQGGAAEILWRQGTSMMLHAENPSGTDREIELPLVYYKGYTAVSEQDKLKVDCGSNFRVRITLPAGYAGDIRVRFSLPFLWLAAKIVSLLTALAWLGMTVCDYRKHKG